MNGDLIIHLRFWQRGGKERKRVLRGFGEWGVMDLVYIVTLVDTFCGEREILERDIQLS